MINVDLWSPTKISQVHSRYHLMKNFEETNWSMELKEAQTIRPLTWEDNFDYLIQ
jgi:hypothetical protein